MLFRVLALLILSFIILALFCSKSKNEPNVSFYYWKTNFKLTEYDKQTLKNYSTKKLYTRFFDLDWDDSKNIPNALGVISGFKNIIGIETVPVVFINNQIFYKISDTLITLTAKAVYEKVKFIYSGVPKEIQLDCDWTETTKFKYFRFIEEFKKISANIKLSATIRLYQIKYRGKTGIPPVNSGALMVYNVGKIASVQTNNSILDANEVDAYINSLNTYPLKLSVALPIFSQGVLFRNDRALYLIPNISDSDLYVDSLFEQISSNRYIVKKSSYFRQYYLYSGDVIRIERPEAEDLLQAAKSVAGKLKNKADVEIIFFRLDSALINRYKKNEIQAVINSFR